MIVVATTEPPPSLTLSPTAYAESAILLAVGVIVETSALVTV